MSTTGRTTGHTPGSTSGGTPSTTDHRPNGPWDARDARDGRDTADRLLRAATDSGDRLIAEAASLVQGWAVLADPIAGAVYSAPSAAAADGVRAAAAPHDHPYSVQLPAAGAVLVLVPAPTTPPEHTGHVAATTAALLEVRGQRAAELRGEQMRLHTTLLRLLLAGHADAAVTALGGGAYTHVTVYRLTGEDTPAAHQVLWRAVRPTLAPHADACTLLGRLDGELVVAEVHRGSDDGRIPRLVSRVCERHGLLAGMAGPLPLAEMPTAYCDAAAARHSATPAHRVVPADAIGAPRLAPLLPAAPYARWAAAVLRPLDPAHQHLLLVWLRTGSKPRAAEALGLSAGTVRARIREAARLLDADPEDATVRAHLLLALRAPAPAADLRPGGSDRPDTPALPSPDGARREARREARLEALPSGILDTGEVRAWAAGLVDGLEPRLRIALTCWLRHHARTAPAANELHVHRTTLTTWLYQCADHLAQNLADATVRAEIHLALGITRSGSDDPADLPRRGGRTYRRA
ncbi:helix-turn-helix domain-containing protein [Streptomyces californicus]|uniref:helix-turn-helix domain-containing protein n=1 Tax=Streptomyces californicus TaxID=67351 RepID=UPI0037BCA03F